MARRTVARLMGRSGCAAWCEAVGAQRRGGTKVVTADQRRYVVTWLCERRGVGVTRACRLAGISRASCRYALSWLKLKEAVGGLDDGAVASVNAWLKPVVP